SMNPVLPGLAVLFAGLFCLLKLSRDGGWKWTVLAAVILAANLEYKLFFALHVFLVLGLVALLALVPSPDARFLPVLVLARGLALRARPRLGRGAGASAPAADRPGRRQPRRLAGGDLALCPSRADPLRPGAPLAGPADRDPADGREVAPRQRRRVRRPGPAAV